MDTAMLFHLEPERKLVDLLVFLKDSRISFTAPHDHALAHALLPELGHPALSPDLLASLGLLGVLEHFPRNDATRAFLALAQNGNELRACSKAFKHFCGSENLTPGGKITRNTAVELIRLYTALHKLDGDDSWIRLDEALKVALGTEANGASKQALIALVETVFA
jgi:hypothetical protein